MRSLEIIISQPTYYYIVIKMNFSLILYVVRNELCFYFRFLLKLIFFSKYNGKKTYDVYDREKKNLRESV